MTPANIPNDVGHVIFDGNGHTIIYEAIDTSTNTVIRTITTNGLFSTQVIDDVGPSYNITIKNLGVEGGELNSGKGFICDSNFAKKASSSISIDNCYSTANVTGGEAGGIVGENFGIQLNGTTTISNCYSFGDITTADSGGIVGYQFGNQAYAGSKLYVFNCHNTGSISGQRSGGIAGACVGRSSESGCEIRFDSCYSTGDITAYNADDGGGGLIGAFFGGGNNDSNSGFATIYVQNCYATGSASNSSGGL